MRGIGKTIQSWNIQHTGDGPRELPVWLDWVETESEGQTCHEFVILADTRGINAWHDKVLNIAAQESRSYGRECQRAGIVPYHAIMSSAGGAGNVSQSQAMVCFWTSRLDALNRTLNVAECGHTKG